MIGRMHLYPDQEASLRETLEAAGVRPGYGVRQLQLEGVGINHISAPCGAILSFCPTEVVGYGEVFPIGVGRLILPETPEVYFARRASRRIAGQIATMKHAFLNCECTIYHRGDILVIEAVQRIKTFRVPVLRRDLTVQRGGYRGFVQQVS